VAAVAGLVFWRVRQGREKKVEVESPGIEEKMARQSVMPSIASYDGDETILIEEEEEESDKTLIMGQEEPLRATLTVVKSLDLEAGKKFEIKGMARVGRASASDIRIPDAPVSRRHAEIYLDGNTYFIRDMGSKYGTMVDGKNIMSHRTTLRNGAKIQLGSKTVLAFHLTPSSRKIGENDLTKKYE
jgi:pSer/pThr/pTyr-binding forkhead associated (FHA) protein